MSLSTPAAIVIAGAMIAGATYLGLSRRASTSAESVGRPLALASAPPVATASVEEVGVEVRAALDGYRPMLRDRCLADASRDPSYKVDWTLEYTFAPDGTQVVRGAIEHGDLASSRPTLTRCLLDALPALQIAPPNTTVQVDVPFTFP